MRPLTMSEKVLARASGRPAGSVGPGDVVTARVDLVMSHDNAALIGNVFRLRRGLPPRTPAAAHRAGSERDRPRASRKKSRTNEGP